MPRKRLALALLTLALAAVPAQGASSTGKHAALEAWARQQGDVFELLPAGANPPLFGPIEWQMTIRFHPYEQHGWTSLVLADLGDQHNARLYEIPGPPILDQVIRLKARHPLMTPQEIARQITVRRVVLTDSECPRLRDMIESLRGESLSPSMPDRMSIHGLKFDLWQDRPRIHLAWRGGLSREEDPFQLPNKAWAIVQLLRNGCFPER